jgi:glycosyltransferase involved in cell wall biosynthesis
MNIVHYLDRDYLDGAMGGVSRFDYELSLEFPDLITCSKYRRDLDKYTSMKPSEVIFITGNDMCLDIPPQFKCLVVHHGCAVTHQQREPNWPGSHYIKGQSKMKDRPNTWFVSPSKFMSREFKKHHDIDTDFHIMHYSDMLSFLATNGNNLPTGAKETRVLGDWRNFNKGKSIIDQLSSDSATRSYEQLNCGVSITSKYREYSTASIFLSLSLSEGCSYSQLDALCLNIPVVSTDVGLFGGNETDGIHCPGKVISYKDRYNIELIQETISEVLNNMDLYSPKQWVKENMNKRKWTTEWNKAICHVASL